MKRFLGYTFALLVAVFCSHLWAQEQVGAQEQGATTPVQALARLFQQRPAQASWFASSFLSQVPLPQVEQILQQYSATGGSFVRADASGDSYTVFMERGTFPAKLALDAQGQIIGLWFGLMAPFKAATLDEGVKGFERLPGKISLVIQEDGKPRGAVHPDDALAVGSAFKLAIISALQTQIIGGKRRWDEVFPLNPAWKSLPSGVLLTWPDSTPLTLATLANEMISISDNTAADALLSIAVREKVEVVAPRNKPFLSTREAFILKDPANAALLTRYRAANEAGRRAVLSDVDKLAMPAPGIFGSSPLATDVEWFFTANELCSILSPMQDLPALHINPGVADQKDWRQVAFKGGSESGVMNLTTALIGRNGKHYCVAATWNNTAAVDESKFVALYGGLLGTLAAESAK